jgi:uncharacterized protein (TIGR03085 family)
VTNWAQVERRTLCDLMLEVGPGAATLCEGWNVADLAAHLVVRERRPDSAIGIVVKPFAGWTERVRTATRDDTAFTDLVEQVRSGPPAWSPVRFVPGVDAATNTVEFFVHHEDVRRAVPGWEPRSLEPALEDVLWSRLARGARLLMRSSPVSLTLDAGDGRRTVAKGDGSQVVARGKPSELTLLAFGRAPQVRLQFEGADDDVRAVVGGSFGV